MALLDAFKAVWDLLAGEPEAEIVEPWQTDEASFEEHFGEAYEDFTGMLSRLDRAQHELYEKTMRTNPEAAVTWVFFVGA